MLRIENAGESEAEVQVWCEGDKCRLDDKCESGVTRLVPSRTLRPAPSFRAPWYPDDVDAVAAAR
jgi:hypothetical protein